MSSTDFGSDLKKIASDRGRDPNAILSAQIEAIVREYARSMKARSGVCPLCGPDCGAA